jgi:predicted AlkP superfamily pyrophosphatase or phosphodiesterase
MFETILNEVFTKEEIARYSQNGNNGLRMYFVIESKTGKTLEVKFYLFNLPYNHNPILLSIPICKLERLETLMKQKLIWSIPKSNKWKNVSDIRAPYGYF